MSYDDREGYITNDLAGRVLSHVEREGKQLTFVTNCGKRVQLIADANGDIQYNGTAVKIQLTGASGQGVQGIF